MSELELAGETVLVAGGSRGIGREVVLGALARGASVAYCSRGADHDDGLRQAAARTGAESRLLSVRADVTNEGQVEAFFDRALAAFGRVDAVACCAGMKQEELFVSLTPAAWDAIMAENLTGAFLVARRALRELVARRGGALVFVGSILQKGSPRGAAAYGASKAALAGMTQAIAREFAPLGIRANQVVTGFVETDMTAHIPEHVRRAVVEFCPQRRLASPTDIARVILFLSSRRAAGISGQLVHATGGFVETAV